MKIKVFLGFMMILLLCFDVKSQIIYQYHPFDMSNSEWSVNTVKYATFGDTIINNKHYSKVYKQENNVPFIFDIDEADYFCAIRNDTVRKQVFGVYKDPLDAFDEIHVGCIIHGADTNEFLLYDFSIHLGDTVQVASFADAEILGGIQLCKFKRVERILLSS